MKHIKWAIKVFFQVFKHKFLFSLKCINVTWKYLFLFALSFISPRVLFWSLSLKLATIIDLKVVLPLLLSAEGDLSQNCFSRNFEV